MKRILFITLSFFVSIRVSAQYEKQWDWNAAGNSSYKVATSVALADGYVIVGSFADTVVLGEYSLVSQGGKDLFVTWLDTEGRVKDVLSFGDEHENAPAGAAALDDELYICSTSVAGNKVTNVSLYVAGKNCQLQQIDMFKVIGKIKIDCLDATDDKLLLGGSLKGKLEKNDMIIQNSDCSRPFLLSMTHEGETIATWQSNGTGNCRLNSITQDDDGGLLLSIAASDYSLSNIHSKQPKEKGNAILLVKLDQTLQPVWTKEALCDGFVESTTIHGNRAGWMIGLNYNDELHLGDELFVPHGVQSSLIVQIDHDGEIKWIRRWQSDQYCRLMDIDCNAEKTVCVGYSYGFLSIQDSIVSESDVKSTSVAVFDTEGELEWYTQMDCKEPNGGKTIICDTASNFVVCGTSQQFPAIGEKGITQSNNKKPIFVGKYHLIQEKDSDQMMEDTTYDDASHNVMAWKEIGYNGLDDQNLLVFPNPAKSVLYWEANQEGAWILDTYDARGVLVDRRENHGWQSGSIDVSSLAPGIYVLKLSSDNSTTYRTIIKE